jgi:1,4-alpha-glucan branching enzyme
MATGLCVFAAEPPPPRARPAPVISPEVKTDRHVTFRLQAPKAGEVVIVGQWPNGRTPMTKDTNGLSRVTVGPIEPGVREYSLQVDSAQRDIHRVA